MACISKKFQIHSYIKLPGYQIHRNDRLIRRGGGVCVLFSIKLPSETCDIVYSEHCEYILVRLPLKNQNPLFI